MKYVKKFSVIFHVQTTFLDLYFSGLIPNGDIWLQVQVQIKGGTLRTTS